MERTTAMKIGNTTESSASFIDYRLHAGIGSPDEDGTGVGAAVRGEKNGKSSGLVSAAVPKTIFDTDAYQVDISRKAMGISERVQGSVVQLESPYTASPPYGRGWSREEELAALEISVERYRKMNENFSLTGSPYDPKEEQERMAAVVSRAASGQMTVDSANGETIGLSPIQQEASSIVKTTTGLENGAVSAPLYTPVTEIRTRHYRWTEENGVEETLTHEQEIAAGKANLREFLENAVTRSIESILKPYASYEEAYDALYQKDGMSFWSVFDEETMSHTEYLKNVNGAFGALANHLNNYLEEFGAEDSFFATLDTAVDGLIDEYGENDIVNQVRRMIATSRSGNTIDTTTDQFEKEVQDATAGTYIEEEQQLDNTSEKKTEDDSKAQKQGLSFLDIERRSAEEEGELLDKLLGKDHGSSFESVGDVLKKRAPEDKDAEFTEKLRRAEEREETPQPIASEAEDKEPSASQPKDGVERLTAIHDGWLVVSESLAKSFAAEKPKYYEKAVEAANAAKQGS